MFAFFTKILKEAIESGIDKSSKKKNYNMLLYRIVDVQLTFCRV